MSGSRRRSARAGAAGDGGGCAGSRRVRPPGGRLREWRHGRRRGRHGRRGWAGAAGANGGGGGFGGGGGTGGGDGGFGGGGGSGGGVGGFAAAQAGDDGGGGCRTWRGQVFSMHGSVIVTNSTFTGKVRPPHGNGAGVSSGDGGRDFQPRRRPSASATIRSPLIQASPTQTAANFITLLDGLAPTGATVSASVSLVNTILFGSMGGATSDLIDNSAGASTMGLDTVFPTTSIIGKGAFATGGNPMLDPAGLKNNGGLTPTIALQPGSAAIDAGTNAAATADDLITDQRGLGFARFVGPVDIGAFEVQPVAPTLIGISPTSVTAGSPNAIITLTGAGFVNTSVADFNGAPLTTTFVSATQLTAVVPSTDLTAASTAAITVVNPAQQGGASNAQTFTVVNPTPPPTPTHFPPSVSAAFGPGGEVIELVNSEGVLTQFDATGTHVLGGGVRYASIAFGPDGGVLEVVGSNGGLVQFDATGVHVLATMGVESASVAFGPGGEVLDVAYMDGSARQFSAAGTQVLATGGVLSVSVAFGPGGETAEVLGTNGVLTQFTAAGAQQLGGPGVQSAGVAADSSTEVLDVIFSDGTLDQFDAFGVHRLGIVP